jgi:hypothetical protein
MSKIESISAPIEGSWEGKPTISVPMGNGKPFTFGVEKAAAIIKHLEAVKAFNTKHPSKALKVDAAAVATMSKEDKASLLALLMAP